MSGRDKTRLLVGDVPLLDRVLAACNAAAPVVVVGEPRATATAVCWTREEPAGGGPAAALAAGLALVEAPVCVLLAGDLPLVTPDIVDALVTAVGATSHADGAVVVDGGGVPQWLCSAWRSQALRALPLAVGGSLRATLGTLDYVEVRVPGDRPAWLDCDTPDDLRRARELA